MFAWQYAFTAGVPRQDSLGILRHARAKRKNVVVDWFTPKRWFTGSRSFLDQFDTALMQLADETEVRCFRFGVPTERLLEAAAVRKSLGERTWKELKAKYPAGYVQQYGHIGPVNFDDLVPQVLTYEGWAHINSVSAPELLLLGTGEKTEEDVEDVFEGCFYLA